MEASLVNATGNIPNHPYFPLNVALAGYSPNSMPAPVMVSLFGAGWCAILLATHVFIQQSGASLTTAERLTAMWFALCGCVHLFFEGYFVYNFLSIAGQMDLFGQLWKEYSLSDSRYLTQDSFLVCMEAVTAVIWGPMSFLCAYFIVKNHPLRHPFQTIISLGQLYGDVLYFGTSGFSHVVYEIVYCRPEGMYFWAYYFFCNAIWIVIPTCLLLSSVVATKRAFGKLKALEKGKKVQ